MGTFEEECVERYFLVPGNAGPIGSVYVADDDLLEIFGAAELDQAHRQLIKSLPPMSILKSRLSGQTSPLPGRKPDYVRILVFLCWMQTTKLRQRGDRDFRQLLSKQLGEDFTGFKMNGLDMMWQHLREFLERVHGIELVLPGIIPSISRIGRTLQMAFPTWRDKAALRKLRQYIPPAHLLDPLTIVNRINTSRYLLGDTMQSFEYNFEKFDIARKCGHREYERTAFWQAWYGVVAEQAAVEELHIIEGEFGGYEIFRVPPVGERVLISTPEDAAKFVPKPLAKLISSGMIFLESLGYGRYRAQAQSPSNMILMHVWRFSQCEQGIIRSSASVNANWVVVSVRGNLGERAPVSPVKREFGWHNGIRVGSGAYLGRSPLSPSVASPVPDVIKVEVGGRSVELLRVGDEMVLPPGVYAGSARASSLGKTHEIVMVGRANEAGETRRLPFDPSRDIPEDDFHYESAPSPGAEPEVWAGARAPASAELITIGEGLYERSARGLSLAEAVDIVRRGISLLDDHPSEWDILRSLADSGWFEPTFLRHFPARRLLQRELSAHSFDETSVLICGPTPLAVVDRLTVAARAAGGEIETWNGASPWSLPRYVFRAPNDGARRDFLRRAAIVEMPRWCPAVSDRADHSDPHGFRVIGKLIPKKGFFAAAFDKEMTDGLYRIERPEGRMHFYYRSVVPGKLDQSYVSPSVALLSHHLRLGGDVLEFKNCVLFVRAAGVKLPSSWARWASNLALCNPGPSKASGAWRYEYPIGSGAVAAISKLVPVARSTRLAASWLESYVRSASNKDRKVYDKPLASDPLGGTYAWKELMSSSGKTVFQVMKILNHGVALVAEIRGGDAGFGKFRETREPRMLLGGVGSLWLVTGEKEEPKLVLEDLDELPDVGLPMVSFPPSLIRASSEFELPATVEAFNIPGQRKITTFITVTRILGAYSVRHITFEEVVLRLREGRLDIPSNEVIAIEVANGEWLTSHFARLPSGSYGLSPGSDPRALPIKTIENRPDSMRLSSGMLIFLSEPRWSPSTEKDVRPEHEVLQSAERWLGRASLAATKLPGGDVIDLLRQHVATTINENERSDMSAAARLLAARQPILEILPQILAKDPAYQKRIQQFELEEQERLKEMLRSKVEGEIEAEKARLIEIRAKVTEAETRVAVAGQRELLLRNETERHDAAIAARIAEAARQLRGDSTTEKDHLRRELDELRDLVLQIPSQVPVTVVAVPEEKSELSLPEGTTATAAAAAERNADEDARNSVLAGLAAATGLNQADLVAILLRSTDDVPVLIGERSSSAAADIVTAIGGDESAVAFCDPSRISWQDLMSDETSGLAVSVAKARATPNILVPIAICGITNGPCEYWLPQFVESRRVGRLPRNLAIIASAGVDGSRVSIPDSVLRLLMPIEISDNAKPIRGLFAGSWPAELDANRVRLADAIDLLSQDLESGALQRAAKTLSRSPTGVAMADVAKLLVRQAKWHASISGDGQYEFKKHFKNIEG